MCIFVATICFWKMVPFLCPFKVTKHYKNMGFSRHRGKPKMALLVAKCHVGKGPRKGALLSVIHKSCALLKALFIVFSAKHSCKEIKECKSKKTLTKNREVGGVKAPPHLNLHFFIIFWLSLFGALCSRKISSLIFRGIFACFGLVPCLCLLLNQKQDTNFHCCSFSFCFLVGSLFLTCLPKNVPFNPSLFILLLFNSLSRIHLFSTTSLSKKASCVLFIYIHMYIHIWFWLCLGFSILFFCFQTAS